MAAGAAARYPSAVPFIPPMLTSRLQDPVLLADPRYIAEPAHRNGA